MGVDLRVGGRAAGAGMLADYTTAVPVFDESGVGRTPMCLKVRAGGLMAVIDSTVLSDVFACNAARSISGASRSHMAHLALRLAFVVCAGRVGLTDPSAPAMRCR